MDRSNPKHDWLSEIYGEMQSLVAIAELTEEEIMPSQETMRLQCAMTVVVDMARRILCLTGDGIKASEEVRS